MKLTEAHAALLALPIATFTTGEAAAALRVAPNHAAQILKRLGTTGHAIRLARGRWAIAERTDPFMLPEALTAPKPSYVSLFSALHHHGLIEQVPDTTYAVTLAPTREVTTPLGRVSLHRVTPGFFFGYEVQPTSGAKVATPEKALVDMYYFAPARSRRFRALPELELAPPFKAARARAMAKRIRSKSRRAFVETQLDRLLGD